MCQNNNVFKDADLRRKTAYKVAHRGNSLGYRAIFGNVYYRIGEELVAECGNTRPSVLYERFLRKDTLTHGAIHVLTTLASAREFRLSGEVILEVAVAD